MNRSFAQVERVISRQQAQQLLSGASAPAFLLFGNDQRQQLLMPAVELARYLEVEALYDAAQVIDLQSIPAQRLETGVIELHANLQQAWAAFEQDPVEALVSQNDRAGYLPGVRHPHPGHGGKGLPLLTRGGQLRALRRHELVAVTHVPLMPGGHLRRQASDRRFPRPPRPLRR